MAITNREEFNEQITVSDVLEQIYGINVTDKKGGKICCPFCNKYKASTGTYKGTNTTVFKCWVGCSDGKGLSSYKLLSMYVNNKNGYPNSDETVELANRTFNTNLKKWKSKAGITGAVIQELATNKITIKKYVSEAMDEVLDILKDKKRIVVQAPTGAGKSRALATVLKEEMNKSEKASTYEELAASLNVGYTIFATPRGSIVEEIAHQYQYSTFYKNDVELPNNKCITTTTHKAPLIVDILNEANEFDIIGSDNEFFEESDLCDSIKDLSYCLVIDEAHLLLSARNIVVKKSKDMIHLETLIKNAKYVIFTTANADDFYQACKDVFDIAAYVKVDRKVPLYNLDQLKVVRIPSDKDKIVKYLIDSTVDAVGRGKKVFAIYNDIKTLQFIDTELKAKGILSNYIHAGNKTDEGINDTYISLIEESVLKSTVTLCTSVVDTGVNIKDNNVVTIVVQSKNSFDDITVTQAFARVRVQNNDKHGNEGILIVNSKKEDDGAAKNEIPLQYYLNAHTKESKTAISNFNQYVSLNADAACSLEVGYTWGLLRANEGYKSLSAQMRVITDEIDENPELVVDKVALYDKARRSYLANNYYSDKFIQDKLSGVFARDVIFEKVDIDLEKEKKETLNEYAEAIGELMESPDFMKNCKKRYLQNDKDFVWEDLDLIKKCFKTRFDELDKMVFRMIGVFKMKSHLLVSFTPEQYILRAYSSQILEKKADRLDAIQKLDYTIYNVLHKEEAEYRNLGDSDYVYIRNMADSLIKHRKALTDVLITRMVIEKCAAEDCFIGTKEEIKAYEIKAKEKTDYKTMKEAELEELNAAQSKFLKTAFATKRGADKIDETKLVIRYKNGKTKKFGTEKKRLYAVLENIAAISDKGYLSLIKE